MCGIAGYITKKNTKLSSIGKKHRKQIFNALLVAMESRGRDSAGVVGIRNGKTHILKNVNKASDFVKFRKYRKFMDNNYPLVIGHTRASTVGKTTQENAHPFKNGTIVGVHNGHLSNYKEIMPNAEVDSQGIFELLNRYDNDYKKAFAEMAGAFAIAWSKVNKKDYSLQLACSGNPIHMANVESLDTIFFASTAEAVQNALKGSNIDSEVFFMPKNYTLTINSDFSEKFEEVKFMEDWNYYAKRDYRDFGDTYGWCQSCERWDENCVCDNEEIRGRERPLCMSCIEPLGKVAYGCEIEGEWLMVCGQCRDDSGEKGQELDEKTIQMYGMYAEMY